MSDERFPALHFPVSPRLRGKTEGDKYLFWDARRGKYIVLTPEEWVRQHVIAWLESEGYPPALIAVEKALEVNGLTKRFDVVVFDRQNRPFLLVECKRPGVAINEDTLHQALIYNRSLRTPYLFLTNGLTHYLLGIKDDGQVQPLENLPRFDRR